MSVGSLRLWTAAGLLLALTVSGSAPAAPAHALDDYPSWDEVEAARSSASATATEIDRIDGFLSRLEQELARLGDVAVDAGAAAERARAEHDAAVERSAAWDAAAAEAGSEAEDASRALGRISVQLHRSPVSDPLIEMLFTGPAESDLLRRLELASRVGDTLGLIETRAAVRRDLAVAAAEQAELAAAERDELAADAEKTHAEALAAERAAELVLARQRVDADRLYAQLAVLRDSSAEAERRYRAGVAAEQAYREQQDAAEENAGSGGGGGSAPPSGVIADPAAARAYAAGTVSARGWGGEQYDCLVWLWNRESGWRVDAHNPSSGAYGIPQSLPASKMASAGDDWRTNAATQIEWGLGYIANRYGSPCAAWDHSERYNWY